MAANLLFNFGWAGTPVSHDGRFAITDADGFFDYRFCCRPFHHLPNRCLCVRGPVCRLQALPHSFKLNISLMIIVAFIFSIIVAFTFLIIVVFTFLIIAAVLMDLSLIWIIEYR